MPVREVKWSDSGELVAILSDQSFYVLRFARDGAYACLTHSGCGCTTPELTLTKQASANMTCKHLSSAAALARCPKATQTASDGPAVVDAHLESGADIDEDGIDDAFELLNEVSEHVRTGRHQSTYTETLPGTSTQPAVFRSAQVRNLLWTLAGCWALSSWP